MTLASCLRGSTTLAGNASALSSFLPGRAATGSTGALGLGTAAAGPAGTGAVAGLDAGTGGPAGAPLGNLDSLRTQHVVRTE